VFFKLLLVGYLNNINSDRALIAFCSDSLAIRWFLRYDIDEPSCPIRVAMSGFGFCGIAYYLNKNTEALAFGSAVFFYLYLIFHPVIHFYAVRSLGF
jgi:hypothetical protein